MGGVCRRRQKERGGLWNKDLRQLELHKELSEATQVRLKVHRSQQSRFQSPIILLKCWLTWLKVELRISGQQAFDVENTWKQVNSTNAPDSNRMEAEMYLLVNRFKAYKVILNGIQLGNAFAIRWKITSRSPNQMKL